MRRRGAEVHLRHGRAEPVRTRSGPLEAAACAKRVHSGGVDGLSERSWHTVILPPGPIAARDRVSGWRHDRSARGAARRCPRSRGRREAGDRLLRRASRSGRRRAAGVVRHVGHRGSAFTATFNEDHILATTQAICEYRAEPGDRRAAVPGRGHARAVRAGPGQRAGGARRQRRAGPGRRPRRVHAHARGVPRDPGAQRLRPGPRADGIVVTPSHNPPSDGGFKYNPPDGGPAGTDITRQIQDRANELLADGLKGVRRIPYARAVAADTTGSSTSSTATCRRWSRWWTWPRSGRPGCASAPTRSAGRAWPTGARSASGTAWT